MSVLSFYVRFFWAVCEQRQELVLGFSVLRITLYRKVYMYRLTKKREKSTIIVPMYAMSIQLSQWGIWQ